MRATHYCENGEAKVCGIWVGKWHCSGGGIHFNTTNNDYCYYYHVFMAASGTHTHTEICGVDKRVIPPSIFNASHQLRTRGKFDLLTGIYFHPFKLHTIIMWCFSRAGGSRKQFFGGIVCCVREYNYCTPKTEFLLLVFILLLLLFVNLHLIAFPHKFWFVDFSRAWTQKHAYNKCSTCTMHENMKHHWWWFIEPHEFGCACIWQKL